MIVDCHVHLNNYEDDTVESLSARLAELNRAMRLNRVDIAVILTSYKVTPGRPSTLRVLEAVRDQPHLYVVAGLSYEQFTPAELDELEPYVATGQAQGAQAVPGLPAVLSRRPALGAGVPVRRAAPASRHDSFGRHLRSARQGEVRPPDPRGRRRGGPPRRELRHLPPGESLDPGLHGSGVQERQRVHRPVGLRAGRLHRPVRDLHEPPGAGHAAVRGGARQRPLRHRLADRHDGELPRSSWSRSPFRRGTGRRSCATTRSRSTASIRPPACSAGAGSRADGGDAKGGEPRPPRRASRDPSPSTRALRHADTTPPRLAAAAPPAHRRPRRRRTHRGLGHGGEDPGGRAAALAGHGLSRAT